MDYGVVIPNRYSDVIQPLVESIHRLIPEPKPDIMIVTDGHRNDYGFRSVPYTDPHFVFAKSVNTGIKALPGKDVILLNDDTVLLEEDFFQKLHMLAMTAEERVGILSPLVVGCVGQRLQRWHERETHWKLDVSFQDVTGDEAVCFPCVYVRRQMLNEIGLLDETIADYGRDDWDLCLRARKAGWRTLVTSLLRIQHGDGSASLGNGRGRSWSVSYARRWQGGRPPASQVRDYLQRRRSS